MVFTVNRRQKTQKTVKAFDMDIALINEQAKVLGCSAADVIHAMCEVLRRETYLRELGESFDIGCADGERMSSLRAEQKLWDCTLTDGLDDAS